jgi:hypothetical protein
MKSSCCSLLTTLVTTDDPGFHRIRLVLAFRHLQRRFERLRKFHLRGAHRPMARIDYCQVTATGGVISESKPRSENNINSPNGYHPMAIREDFEGRRHLAEPLDPSSIVI